MPALPADRPLRWGIVGPGRIAHRFAHAVTALPDAQLSWLCGRDLARAHAFATQWSAPGQPPVRVAADLATLLVQSDVDAVYVATPHAWHGDIVRAALQADKPVLCEKPLVPNRAQAEALVTLAQQRQTFLMEAVWTRFLPIYSQVGAWLREQAIGPVRGLQSSFCFAAPYDANSRLFNPALAGGALLDIGIYNLTVTRWVLQQALGSCPEPKQIWARGQLAPTGVDQRVAATLVFDGVESQFTCGFDAESDNGLTIQGEQGYIRLPHNFWRATQAVLQRTAEPTQTVDAPLAINGFEGEILEATRCIRAGVCESGIMPHSETVATLNWMDQLRYILGVRYPFE
jgi:predicted dehydrogenase